MKLGIIPRKGGETVWANLGNNPDIYLTRVIWSQDGKTLFAGILSRDHKTHSFYRINPDSGKSKVIFKETSPSWLNIGTDLETLENGDLLWSSEKSGKRQIYKISHKGNKPTTDQQITPGNVLVKHMECVDEEAGRLYFRVEK